VTVKHMGHGGGLQAVAECDYGQLMTPTFLQHTIGWGPGACLAQGIGLI